MDIGQYPMQAIAPTVARILRMLAPRSAAAPPIGPIVEEFAGVERVAVLGVDALGVSIYRHWQSRMPFLSGMTKRRSATVRSIMITRTAVNFACMVTGASMHVHGVTTRESAFVCETLFDVLRAHGMTSAGFGRKGWTGNELLGRCADVSAEGRAEDDAGVEEILRKVVRSRQPAFLIAQYGLTDELFHRYGPYAPEAETAVVAADGWLKRCTRLLRAHGYGTLILADHGQHTVESEEGGRRGTHGADIDEDALVPLTWVR